jgi:hypothetical protein
MDDYTMLARAILALCRDYTEELAAPAGVDVRAMSTALAVAIRRSPDSPLLLTLVIRDLTEAVMMIPRRRPHPRRRSSSAKNVIDLGAARKRLQSPELP